MSYKITNLLIFMSINLAFSFETGQTCLEKSQSCLKMKKPVCLGEQLPYDAVSLKLTGIGNINDSLKELKSWLYLSNIPQCWKSLRSLLCSVYLPKCNGSSVSLPNRQLCDISQTHCRMVEDFGGWPEYLRCNSEYFKPGCPIINVCLESFELNLLLICFSLYRDLQGTRVVVHPH